MNGKVKRFCITVTICFVLSMVVFAASYNDVPPTHKYHEAISYLGDVGIIEGYSGGYFKPGSFITRVEAATIIARTACIENIEKNTSSRFSDVAENFWAKPYIMAASRKGIIDGVGNGKFLPGDSVTYNQVIKMIVCMVGKGEDAVNAGGWPNGYVQVAYDNGIIDNDTYSVIMNSSSSGDQPIPRGQVAQFIYNSISEEDEFALEVNDKKYRIGMNASSLGEPDEVVDSMFGIKWYIFGTKTYKDFFAAGVANDKIVALTASGIGFSYNGKKCGDVVDNDNGLKSIANLASDKNDGNICHGVFLFDEGYYYSENDYSETAIAGEAKLNFHLTNGFRVYHGKDILSWSEAAARAARLHSCDMANQNYFAHNSLDGTRFSIRLRAQGIDWQSCSENISAGYRGGFYAYNGWVNSAGHRNNMLGDTKYLGVGGGHNPQSTYAIYFTQDFYK